MSHNRVTQQKKRKSVPVSPGIARGAVSLRHATVDLAVDVENALLGGFVEYEMVFKHRDQIDIRLHARQVHVCHVQLNGESARFQQTEVLVDPAHAHETIRDMKRFTPVYKKALEEEDQGTLIIDLPPQFSAAERDIPFRLRIYYILWQPQGGAHFIHPQSHSFDDHDEFAPHQQTANPPIMFTHNEVESARSWLPCLDRYSQPCTWTFRYTVPSTQTAISSGELIRTEEGGTSDQIMEGQSHLEQALHKAHKSLPHAPRKLLPTGPTRCFHSELRIPTTVKNVGVVVGPWEELIDSTVPTISYFSLPQDLPSVQHTVQFMHKAYHFFQQYLDVSFPYPTYRVVFIPHAYTKMNAMAGLAVMSRELLHDERVIDKSPKARWLLTLALTTQWFGNYISVKAWGDMWLRFGLSAYLAGIFFQHMYGWEDHALQVHKSFRKVAQWDEGKPPLHWTVPLHPIQYFQRLLMNKAPIVLEMMERRMGPGLLRKIISQWAKPVSSKEARISTRLFLKSLKNEGWRDIKSFEHQWISHGGCPKLLSGFSYNKGGQQTEFVLKQLSPLRERRMEGGPLVVRINELEGTFDHVIPVVEDIQGINLHSQSRARKSRRKTVQFANGTARDIDLSKRDSPLLWIRVDPKCFWGPLVEFRQPEYMWIHQMELDRDPVAQYQSIRALHTLASSTASEALSRLMADSNALYSLRIEAVRSLGLCASKEQEWISLDKLLNYFRAQYFDSSQQRVSPNDFSTFSSYALKKAIISSVSKIKDKEGYTPSDVLDFIIKLLQSNDNSQNQYADHKYVATIIHALVNTNTSAPGNAQHIGQLIVEQLKKEQQQPSFQHTVTVACLKALAQMQNQKKLPLDLDVFLSHAQVGHEEVVRMTAFKCMVLLGSPGSRALKQTMDMLENIGECGRLKYKVLSAWSEYITTDQVRVAPYQEATEENVDLCLFLWRFINSRHTAFDSRLRWTAMELYQNIWGQDTPSCLPPVKEPPPKLNVPTASTPTHTSPPPPPPLDSPVPAPVVETNSPVAPPPIQSPPPPLPTTSPLTTSSAPLATKRKQPAFKASFHSADNILHIDILNPAKRQKLIQEQEASSPSTEDRSRPASGRGRGRGSGRGRGRGGRKGGHTKDKKDESLEKPLGDADYPGPKDPPPTRKSSKSLQPPPALPEPLKKTKKTKKKKAGNKVSKTPAHSASNGGGVKKEIPADDPMEWEDDGSDIDPPVLPYYGHFVAPPPTQTRLRASIHNSTILRISSYDKPPNLSP